MLSALSKNLKVPVSGVYSLDDDTLVICLGLDPKATPPATLETTEADHHLLITLRRLSKIGAATIDRSSQHRKE